MQPSSDSDMVNTARGIAPVSNDTLTVQIVFTSPLTTASIGWPPYDPFLIVNQDRTKEIHLNNYAPTALADTTLFGTEADASVPGSGLYYRTSSNISWALNIPISWDYPFEEAPVNSAHLHFGDWLSTSGTSYPDWYINNTGYRNSENIYRAFGINTR